MENPIEHFDTEAFIAEIEKREELWNAKSDDYSNRIKKKTSWEDILKIFISNFENLSSSQKNELGK